MENLNLECTHVFLKISCIFGKNGPCGHPALNQIHKSTIDFQSTGLSLNKGYRTFRLLVTVYHPIPVFFGKFNLNREPRLLFNFSKNSENITGKKGCFLVIFQGSGRNLNSRKIRILRGVKKISQSNLPEPSKILKIHRRNFCRIQFMFSFALRLPDDNKNSIYGGSCERFPAPINALTRAKIFRF